MAKGKHVSPSVTVAGTYIELVAGKVPREPSWHPPARYQSVEMPVEEPPERTWWKWPHWRTCNKKNEEHMERASREAKGLP